MRTTRRSIPLGAAPEARRPSLIRLAPLAVLLALSACGDVPESTENARGVLEGVNLVLAMSVLVLVLAVGLIAAAVAAERFFRSRAALAEGGPPVEEDEEEELTEETVAGIRVGRAPVPAWLYGAYVLIPIFAFAYIFSNIRPPADAGPDPTPTPIAGPCTECEIAANAIEFTENSLEVAAGEEITVTFDNTDQVVHDFTAWPGAEAGTGDQVATTGILQPGQTGEATFNADDAQSFNCTVHPGTMIGTIEAAEGGGAEGGGEGGGGEEAEPEAGG